MNTLSLASIIVFSHLFLLNVLTLDLNKISKAQIVSAITQSAKISARSISEEAFSSSKRRIASINKNKKLIAKN